VKRETGRAPRTKAPAKPADRPKPTAQANLTDSDSRIMPTSNKGWGQSYNAQGLFANGSMLMIGGFVSQNTNDRREVGPAVEILKSLPPEIGKVRIYGGDNGFFSEANGEKCEEAGIEPFIAAGRLPHHVKLQDTLAGPVPPGEDATFRERMQYKLREPAGKAFYALRKQVAEPAFGIIKEVIGFREFSFRGLEKVQGEWTLVMCCYNLKMMFNMTMARRLAKSPT
jgi:hypothetical protein